MKQRILSIFVVLAVLSPATLRAQTIDSPFRFLDHGQFAGVWAGYISAEEGRIGIGPQPAAAFGASWSLRVSGPFSIGADIGYMPSTRIVRDTVFVASDSMFRQIGEADVSLVTIMGNLRLNLTGARTWYGFQPFGILGAGVAIDFGGEIEEETALDPALRYDFGTSFAGQFGAGVDWFPTSRISLRADARSLLWKLSVPEAYRLTENGRSFPDSEWEQNLAITAGLSIHF